MLVINVSSGIIYCNDLHIRIITVQQGSELMVGLMENKISIFPVVVLSLMIIFHTENIFLAPIWRGLPKVPYSMSHFVS